MSAEKSKFSKAVEQIQEQKMPTRIQMLEDVFMLARKQAVQQAPHDRGMMAALLNFQAEMEAIVKEFEKK